MPCGAIRCCSAATMLLDAIAYAGLPPSPVAAAMPFRHAAATLRHCRQRRHTPLMPLLLAPYHATLLMLFTPYADVAAMALLCRLCRRCPAIVFCYDMPLTLLFMLLFYVIRLILLRRADISICFFLCCHTRYTLPCLLLIRHIFFLCHMILRAPRLILLLDATRRYARASAIMLIARCRYYASFTS